MRSDAKMSERVTKLLGNKKRLWHTEAFSQDGRRGSLELLFGGGEKAGEVVSSFKKREG